jgi:glycosyltransferase involved in cell wall biosynthesis
MTPRSSSTFATAAARGEGERTPPDVAVRPQRLRVLVVTQLFPTAVDPMNAVFNKLQCVALSRLCDVDVRAVVPSFPGARLFRRWSTAGRCADIPPEEVVDGLRVRHPRVLFVPRVGAALSPALYLACLWPQVRALRGRVDVVLGCWASPDGVASIFVAKLLGAASVVKVHGSDLNVLTRRRSLRAIMGWALPKADRLVAVSRPLAEQAVALGVPAERVDVVRNGVDSDLFRIRDRSASRAELGIASDARWLLYVGLLDRIKGVAELLAAFDELTPRHPDLRLAIVGDGREMPLCRAAAERHPGRIVVTGARPPEDVARWMGACDVLTLPSWNEGTPNVLLEAFASGRRVVATRTGGIPDLVTDAALGELVPPQDARSLAEALRRAAYAPYDPPALRAAAPYGWDDSAAQLLRTLSAARSAHCAQRE